MYRKSLVRSSLLVLALAALMLGQVSMVALAQGGEEDVAEANLEISGPVTAINGSSVTIYGFVFELAPDDPLLATLQIGDEVEIEANISLGADGGVVISVIEAELEGAEEGCAKEEDSDEEDSDDTGTEGDGEDGEDDDGEDDEDGCEDDDDDGDDESGDGHGDGSSDDDHGDGGSD